MSARARVRNIPGNGTIIRNADTAGARLDWAGYCAAIVCYGNVTVFRRNCTDSTFVLLDSDAASAGQGADSCASLNRYVTATVERTVSRARFKCCLLYTSTAADMDV